MIQHINTMRNESSIAALVAQAAVDEARAAGLHGIADELDSIRARVATLALRLWRGDGGAL